MLHHGKVAILIILLGLAFNGIGCGPSYEERQAREKTEKEEQVRKREAEISTLSGQISEKYNSIYFPPRSIGTAAFTYELQNFFSTVGARTILFTGYLEDVEKEEHGIIVEFLCPLGKDYYLHKRAIRFRLTAPEERAKQFLEAEREDPSFLSLRYYAEPDYFVVARIEKLVRAKRYEMYSSGNGDEIEVDIEIAPSFASTGELIEALPIPAYLTESPDN
ncbi:MAG: hypothetical protein C4532_03265 [Candidatus Abyssobacteria bacterium SURF_17]|uniref:Uncharacterized protein n=1 Tax=Candidatus Abyssobacteria bacterium SURF_17 TaxID=2093361 RepID=A0A419F6K9_9BACT|nr:MAG: hypothetical protein C4532_03265 [Candidatus Abyssubacteria bacterium SURF_17]